MLKVFYSKLLGLIFACVCKEVAWNTILLLQGPIFVDLIFYIRRGVAVVEMGKNSVGVREKEMRVCMRKRLSLRLVI